MVNNFFVGVYDRDIIEIFLKSMSLVKINCLFFVLVTQLTVIFWWRYNV
ncbi:hypothetical protein VIBNISOn1_560079 [Vibrio nigripulchritudo SOn1]|uniref:Uncharacterized protein n=1 Tax=Vibrio nigripulchritudo SOn1 TaxID=1238450 RepID=A0AAV2VVZ0_9VIBR|nr:hypothetical protein VIBNISOn1_560079 [Vibrio nigripulchritudo SOn1]